MNSSSIAEPRRGARRHRAAAGLRAAAALALYFTVAACSDDAAAGADFDPFDSGQGGLADFGDMADAAIDCDLLVEGRCLDDPEVRCLYVADLTGLCEDADGDCWVGDCVAGHPAAEVIADCDDTRADVHPRAPELCDEIDHDCDGDPLGPYGVGEDPVGAACMACDRDGKLECSVDDPTRVVCSVLAGQSDALDPLPAETCDGRDEDCDGVVDEGCTISTGGATPSALAVCPDGAVVMVADGAVVLLTPGEGPDAPYVSTELRPAEQRAVHPACGPAGLAWIELVGEACITEAGIRRCPGAIWARPAGEELPRELAVLGEVGPPVVADTAIYWHSVAVGQPVIIEWSAMGDSTRRLFDDATASDPTPPVEGTMLVRSLEGDDARMVLRSVDEPGLIRPISSPPGAVAPAAPTRSPSWLAWTVGDTLWTVPADDLRGGFQPVANTGPQRRPRLAGSRLVWLDDGVHPAALRSLDLGTGTGRVLAEGEIDEGRFDANADMVVWIADVDGNPTVFRRRLTPITD